MTATTSPSLLLRLRNRDDADAWGRLVSIYSPLLFAWLRRYAVPAAEADDLAQEVLQAVALEMPTFAYDKARGSFRGWLRTVLINRLRHYRRSQRFGVGAEFFDNLLDQLEDERSSLSDLWDQEHDRHVLTRLLELVRDEFEPTTWEAFTAVAIEGEEVSVVAERLGRTPNAVRVARCRVLKRLQEEAAFLNLEA